MAVIRKKEKSPEKQVDKFIEKGAAVKADKSVKFRSMMLRMPISIFEKIDECIEKKPWKTRTQWIMDAIGDKLQEEAEE